MAQSTVESLIQEPHTLRRSSRVRKAPDEFTSHDSGSLKSFTSPKRTKLNCNKSSDVQWKQEHPSSKKLEVPLSYPKKISNSKSCSTRQRANISTEEDSNHISKLSKPLTANSPRIHNTRSSTANAMKEQQLLKRKRDKLSYEFFLYRNLPKCSIGCLPVYKNYNIHYPEKPCYICGDVSYCIHSLENLGFTSNLPPPPQPNPESYPSIIHNFILALRRWKQQNCSLISRR